MKLTILSLWFWTLFFIPCIAADTEKPPENLIKHFEWCSDSKDTAALISRYEGFWTLYHPKDEQYEDAIHHTFVRLTAYRLATLYADVANPKKSRDMLQWLESTDQAISK